MEPVNRYHRIELDVAFSGYDFRSVIVSEKQPTILLPLSGMIDSHVNLL